MQHSETIDELADRLLEGRLVSSLKEIDVFTVTSSEAEQVGTLDLMLDHYLRETDENSEDTREREGEAAEEAKFDLQVEGLRAKINARGVSAILLILIIAGVFLNSPQFAELMQLVEVLLVSGRP